MLAGPVITGKYRLASGSTALLVLGKANIMARGKSGERHHQAPVTNEQRCSCAQEEQAEMFQSTQAATRHRTLSFHARSLYIFSCHLRGQKFQHHTVLEPEFDDMK